MLPRILEAIAAAVLAGAPLPGDLAAVDELAEVLVRPASAPAERYFALYSLLHREEPEALGHLLRIAKGPYPPPLRAQVLEGFRLRPRPEAFDGIVDLLGDASPEVSAAAARALESCQGPEALGKMTEALADARRPPSVRRALAENLGSLGDFTAIAPLVAALRDPDEGVRAAAKGALEFLTQQSFQSDPAVAWARWLERNGGLTRETWMAERMRVLRRRLAAAEAELRTLREERDRLARERLLASAAAKNWGAVLETLRQDRSPELRAAAAQALAAEGGNAEVAAALRKAFQEDPDVRVRSEAIRSIAAGGDPQALALAISYLDAPGSRENSEEPVVIAAIDAAARLLARDPPARRSQASLSRLRSRLGDPAPRILIAALKALADLKDGFALPVARERLSHPDREVRLYAAQALALLGGPPESDALAKRLGEERDSRVCENLLRGLGAIGTAAHLQAVLDRLEEPDERVREESLKAALSIAARSFLEPALVEDVADRLEKSGREAAALDWLAQAALHPKAFPIDASPEAVGRIQARAAALASRLSAWPRAVPLWEEVLRRRPSDRESRLAFFRAAAQAQEEAKALDALAKWLAEDGAVLPPQAGSACAAAIRTGKADSARRVFDAARSRPADFEALRAEMKASLGALPLPPDVQEWIDGLDRPGPAPEKAKEP